ncbi:MAG: hypothetical protein ACYCPR_03940 [Thermoplasmataceae archaeon]
MGSKKGTNNKGTNNTYNRYKERIAELEQRIMELENQSLGNKEILIDLTGSKSFTKLVKKERQENHDKYPDTVGPEVTETDLEDCVMYCLHDTQPQIQVIYRLGNISCGSSLDKFEYEYLKGYGNGDIVKGIDKLATKFLE